MKTCVDAGDFAIYLERRFPWKQQELRETVQALLEREFYMDFNGRLFAWDEEEWQKKSSRAEEHQYGGVSAFSKIETILIRGRE